MVAIVQALFKKADVPLELVFRPFKRALKSTKFGMIDGLFNFYKTDERLEFFDYSEPIITNPLVFFVYKDSTLKYDKLEDLKGLTVGVMRGYTYGIDFDNSTLFIKNKANKHEDALKRVALNRVNAYPCDKLVGLNVARNNNYMSKLKILPKPLKVMDGHIGFTKGKHRKVILKLNTALEEMKKNNTIEKMINDYIAKNL